MATASFKSVLRVLVGGLVKPALAAGLLLGATGTVGCASMFMKGGELVDDDFVVEEVLVSYQAEGIVPPGVSYQLVRHDGDLAMFEKSADGSGALMQTHWTDADADHFAGWVATGPAFEFVVPTDRTLPASRFVYPDDTYEVEEVDGEDRPIPSGAVAPVTRLLPLGEGTAVPSEAAPQPAGMPATNVPGGAAPPPAAELAAEPEPEPLTRACEPVDAASVPTAPVPEQAWAIAKGRVICITQRNGAAIQGEVAAVDGKTATLIRADGKIVVVTKKDAAGLRVDR
jgi:hypothetical protein